MLKKLKFMAVLFAALVSTQGLQAASFFTLSPVSTSAKPGDTITLDLLTTGLKLGGYDLDIQFDPTYLTLTDVQFGPYLGLADQSSTWLGVDSVNLFGVSFENPVDLEALQPNGTFRLGSFSFLANPVATTISTAVRITRADYSTPLGAFASDAQPGMALLTINAATLPPPSVVPEPSTKLLLAAAAIGLVGCTRRRALR